MIDYIINEPKMFGDNQVSHIIGTCLSTDTKPVLGIYFNSLLFETDTQTWYVFDKTKTWKKSSGGGGGTTVVANPELAGTEDDLTGLQVEETKYKIPGGAGVFVVNATISGDTTTLDKTWKEIKDAGVAFIVSQSDPGPDQEISINCSYALTISSYIDAVSGEMGYSIDTGIANYTTNSENGYPSYIGEK